MLAGNYIRTLGVIAFHLFALLVVLSGYFWIGLAQHFFGVGIQLWGTLNPRSRLFGKIQTSCEKESLWLTFDDGPDPKETIPLLDLLDKYDMKATFFLIGQRAEKYPELVWEIHRRGHQIGNHTWSHSEKLFWCNGPKRTEEEIKRCQEALTSIIGSDVTVFRAPVGHHNLFVHPTIYKLGLKLIGWNVRGFDGVSKDELKITRRILKTVQPGSIILLHEGTGMTCNVTQSVIDYTLENGWKFKNPSQIVERQLDNY